MRLLVIGAGLMGYAAAFDMARAEKVRAVTLADADAQRAQQASARINSLVPGEKVRAVVLDAADQAAALAVMRGHDAVLSAVPYFLNLGLAQAAVEAGCHFADLGGNNRVVRQTYELSAEAERRGVALAPDCGLSPGMASILAGELMRRIGGRADALKIYVGGLPENPRPPFFYHLVFSVEGLINEFVEPAHILREGRITEVEPLSEPELFELPRFAPLTAFHTSGGTSTLPETFAGSVGECFEKTLRYPQHFGMLRALQDLGLFSKQERRVGGSTVSPRELVKQLFAEKMSSEEPDLTIMRVEAHRAERVLSFTLVDRYDHALQMTSMMRTTAWPASVVVQMLASGAIAKRGAVHQERDVPAAAFLAEMAARGIEIEFQQEASPVAAGGGGKRELCASR